MAVLQEPELDITSQYVDDHMITRVDIIAQRLAVSLAYSSF